MSLSIYDPIYKYRNRQFQRYVVKKGGNFNESYKNKSNRDTINYQNSSTNVSDNNNNNGCHNSDAGFLNTHSQTGGHFYSM